MWSDSREDEDELEEATVARPGTRLQKPLQRPALSGALSWLLGEHP